MIQEEKIKIGQLLLSKLAQGDSVAIEEIYKAHFNMVQKLVVKSGGSFDDARDIFQEAMLVMYEKTTLSVFSLTCPLSTYIYAVCKRLCYKKMDKSWQTVALEEEHDYAGAEADIALYEKQVDEFIVLQSAMYALGEPCKSLLESFYVEKLDMQAIAERFGYENADNAKAQKYRCLMRLKKIFFEQYNTAEE